MSAPTMAPGDTMPALLLHHASVRPRRVAMRHKTLGVWHEITYATYGERVARLAGALRALGVGDGDVVAVHSENRPEWLLVDLAVQGMGAVSVGVYPTSPATEVEYLLGHSETTVLVVEDEEQLDKALEVRDRLPKLRHVVIVDPRGVDVAALDGVMTLAELEASAPADSASSFAESVAALDPAACATIVYTSGTTGPPKGAMLSHANLVASAAAGGHVFPTTERDEVLSYLPLCHVAEKLISLIGALRSGYVVNFGEGPDTFPTDLREVQPTVFLGVPRVWEKLHAGVEVRMSDASGLKRAAFHLAQRLGHGPAERRMSGQVGVLDRVATGVAWLIVFRSLRHKLGMGRVRIAISGAAPIAPQVLRDFWTMGVDVLEGYAQTENTAVCTFTPRHDVRLGLVGVAVEGVEVRIDSSGEILTRSPCVFMGYLKNPEATAATVDADGWLHTGDVGELEDDFLHITDRMKDVIITSGGKNISPSEIENRIKVSPLVKEAIVIGDGRKYLTALIGLEPDTAADWATRRGVGFTTYRDLSERPELRDAVAAWLAEVNGHLAQVETVKRFEMLPIELDHEDGQLTATQKVKRAAISEQFSELIEGMYAGGGLEPRGSGVGPAAVDAGEMAS